MSVTINGSASIVNKTVNLTPELFERFVTDMREHLSRRRKTMLEVSAMDIHP